MKGMVGFDYCNIRVVMKSGKFLSIGQGYTKNDLIEAVKMATTTNWNSRLSISDVKSAIVLLASKNRILIIISSCVPFQTWFPSSGSIGCRFMNTWVLNICCSFRLRLLHLSVITLL